MMGTGALRALIRFEMQAGGRVALRTVAPVAGLLAAAGVLAGDPLLPFAIAKALFFPPRIALLPGVMAALLFTGLAAAADRRLAAGAGWLRHLPLSSQDRFIGTSVGLWLSQLPFLALLLLGGALAVAMGPAEPALWRIAGMPLTVWVTAVIVARGARGGPRWLLALLAAVGGAGAWWGVAAVAAVASFGTLIPVRRRAVVKAIRRRQSWRVPLPERAELWIRMSSRAAGRPLLGAALAPALAVLPAALFVANNELSPRQVLGAVLLGGGVGMVLAVGSGAEALRRRRPPWPWARSLPWTVRERVLMDAGLFGAMCIPAAVLVVFLHPLAGGCLVVSLPLLAVRGAAALRATEQLQGGAVGSLLLEGLCGAAMIALLPHTALLAASLTIPALRSAVATGRERPVARWQELDHLEAGDPMSV